MTKKVIKKKAEGKAGKKISFEDALARLEQVVQQLESGQTGLSDSLECYEQGIKYLKVCYRSLESAERKIELLVNLDEDGKASAAPFDDELLSLEEKAQSRSRRRRKRTPDPGDIEPPGLF